MAVKIDTSLCDHCGTCIAVCPANALMLLPEDFIIDPALCTTCGSCVKICPFGALELSHE